MSFNPSEVKAVHVQLSDENDECPCILQNHGINITSLLDLFPINSLIGTKISKHFNGSGKHCIAMQKKMTLYLKNDSSKSASLEAGTEVAKANCLHGSYGMTMQFKQSDLEIGYAKPDEKFASHCDLLHKAFTSESNNLPPSSTGSVGISFDHNSSHKCIAERHPVILEHKATDKVLKDNFLVSNRGIFMSLKFFPCYQIDSYE